MKEIWQGFHNVCMIVDAVTSQNGMSRFTEPGPRPLKTVASLPCFCHGNAPRMGDSSWVELEVSGPSARGLGWSAGRACFTVMPKTCAANPFRKGHGCRSIPSAPNDIPPAVAVARARLGLEQAAVPTVPTRERSPRRVASALQDAPPQTEARATFSLSNEKLVTHSGGTLVRLRPGAPWAPSSQDLKPMRGSISLVLNVAALLERTTEAEQLFDALVYAPGSAASKNHLFSTWCKVCDARGIQALPATVASLQTNAAIFLRSAGYRAVKSFHEVKDRHKRAGYDWTPALDTAVHGCKQVAVSGPLGPQAGLLKFLLSSGLILFWRAAAPLMNPLGRVQTAECWVGSLARPFCSGKLNLRVSHWILRASGLI